MIRQLTAPQLAFDVVLAGLCFAMRLTIGFDSPAMFVVVALMAAALAMRRLSPVIALGVAWLGALIQMAALLPPDVSNVAILAVLYATARYGDPAVKWAGLASAGAGAVISTAYLYFQAFPLAWFTSEFLQQGFRLATIGSLAFVASLSVLGLSWTAGLLARTRRTARATRLSQAAAEREVVIEQERNRIARDMHDIVAHSLAVVVAQADGARYATEPRTKDEALATIAVTAREALADVRLLLGQLRHRQDAGPQPAIADLDRLVVQLRASGLTIAFRPEGEVPTLPAGQQLALYRITQEALTNALRHGDTTSEVMLALRWTADAAELEITSALPRDRAEPHQGHGLAGMRERAILAGGTLDAGPDGDSWVVRARIPFAAQVHA